MSTSKVKDTLDRLFAEGKLTGCLASNSVHLAMRAGKLLDPRLCRERHEKGMRPDMFYLPANSFRSLGFASRTRRERGFDQWALDCCPFCDGYHLIEWV
jgi:hypothetical protein